MTRLAALLSIAIATSANAQQLLHPGDTAFAPARVRLDVDTIVVLVTPPDSLERLSVTLVRRLERVEAYGQAIYRETQRYQQPDGAFTLDTLDVSARTLAPLRYFTWSKSGWSDVRIDGAHITGEVASHDSAAWQIDSTAREPFLVSMMNESFIAAYP